LTLLDIRSGWWSVRHPPGYSFTSIAFTSDDRLFATGTPDDKAVKLWEVSLPGSGAVSPEPHSSGQRSEIRDHEGLFRPRRHQ